MTADPSLTPFLKACDTIAAFEMSAKALHWRHAGFHVWPVVKYVLVKQLIAAMNAGYAPTERYAIYPSFIKKKQPDKSLKARVKRLRNPPPPVQDNLPCDELANHDIWVLGSASGFYDLNGQIVCQHHHAVRQALFDNGTQSLGLYSGVENEATLKSSLYGANLSLDPFIRHVTQKAPVRPLSEAYLRRHFAGLDGVIATTGHNADAIFAYIDTLIGRLAYTIKRLTPVFRTAPPRAVFSSNYASFYGWALAYLCRRYKRPFIDIQHGIQGHYNGAYYFARTPRRDWRITPQAQLSWSAPDAALFCEGHAARKACVIGPTWEGLAPFLPARPPTHTLGKTARRKSKGPLLVYIGQAAEDVLIAQQLAQRGLNVVFRAHPLRRGMSSGLVSDVVWTDLEGDTASDMALPYLLEQAQGIITGYSAVILEACLQGIPCFASGPFATLVSKDYASALNGLLSLADTESTRGVVDQTVDWATRLHSLDDQQPPDRIEVADALRIVGVMPKET